MADGSSRSQASKWKEKSRSAQNAIGDEIMDKTFRRTEESGRYAFITRHILQDIWTYQRLADVFAGVKSQDRPNLSSVRVSHLKIMSILVIIGWGKWSKFKSTFVDFSGRTDYNLPLDGPAVFSPHFNKSQVQQFVQSQSTFLPASFHENEDREYASNFQMPFLTTPQAVSDKGSYCSVEKVIIVSRQYRNRQGERNLEVSLLDTLLANSQVVDSTI